MNKKHRIVYITDMDVKGSGYFNISVNLLKHFVERGNEAIVVGLQYDNSEHYFPFGILPAKDLNEVYGTTHNLVMEYKPDAVVIALDIPLQMALVNMFRARGISIDCYGIFPLESPPITMTWAMSLMQLKGRMCMSKFGTGNLNENGVSATHIPIGLDQNSWRIPSDEERKSLRKALGYEEDDFVVLTVADNQERKNLTASMEMVSGLKKLFPDKNIKYNLVTREHLAIGYCLSDYAIETGIINNLSIFERGIPFKELWTLYATSDVFLLTSKSEGLGMPVLEAMSSGLLVVGSDCCAIKEHLDGGNNGYPIKIKTSYRDSFGNGMRYLADVKSGTNQLGNVLIASSEEKDRVRTNAKNYVSRISFDLASEILEKELSEKGN